MTDTKAPLPVIGSRCWRDLISPESGATVLSLAPEYLSRPDGGVGLRRGRQRLVAALHLGVRQRVIP
jgi:hypothetical protein